MSAEGPPEPGARPGEVDRAVDHLFRRASGQLVAALTRLFGVGNLDLAEDVVQETLLQALDQWPLSGIPANPAGWLYRAARNRAIDALRRAETRQRLNPQVRAVMELSGSPAGGPAASLPAWMLDDAAIAADTLRLMFVCCYPALPVESQLALILKVLAGFGTGEVARALLAEPTAVEKRLYRAKQRIRDARIAFELPPAADLASRLNAVLAALYLMFNEGYSSSFSEHPIRRDVCLEAMRLTKVLTEHPIGQRPEPWALLALMCFHAARFDARTDGDGHLMLLRDQDRTRWCVPLIAEGFRALGRAAAGESLGAIQFEAGIAALHCLAPRWEATDWPAILRLYDLLLEVKPTPVVALNRAVALAEVRGPRAGLEAVELVVASGALDGYYLVPAIIGDLHLRLGEPEPAARYLARAHELTASPAERRLLKAKLRVCGMGRPARDTLQP